MILFHVWTVKTKQYVWRALSRAWQDFGFKFGVFTTRNSPFYPLSMQLIPTIDWATVHLWPDLILPVELKLLGPSHLAQLSLAPSSNASWDTIFRLVKTPPIIRRRRSLIHSAVLAWSWYMWESGFFKLFLAVSLSIATDVPLFVQQPITDKTFKSP